MFEKGLLTGKSILITGGGSGLGAAMGRRFAELGIAFAYPTQTTYTAAPDGTLVMPWPPGMAKS